VRDVDWLGVPSFDFVNNELRTLKTEERRVPIHPEILWLGFFNYYKAIAALLHAHHCGSADGSVGPPTTERSTSTRRQARNDVRRRKTPADHPPDATR
jgi:hypothetical protein